VKVVGLMSGTSLDGIDAALVELGGDAERVEWRLVASDTVPYPRARRDQIHEAVSSGDPTSLTRLHVDLGEWFAEAVIALCRTAGVELSQVDLVGSHGQTIWHLPPTDGVRGGTLQLGCPATIAERTGIDVVSDFRSRDMAAGGEGAPLVPWVDQLLFRARHSRILLNVGGMANLTRVPPHGAEEPVIAFDTGPGNALIDAAVELATGGDESFDAAGGWARRGVVDDALLADLLEHPYFRRPPPKSTGRETFGRPFVRELVARSRPSSSREWSDLIATLTALTARTIALAVTRWVPTGRDGELIVTGGGGRNPVLVEMLTEAMAPTPVSTGETLGFPPAAKEAVAFAVLAWAHVRGIPASLPEVTGAAGPRVLGSLTPGGPR
jgi:anhydro-N-acetylmuramic acid kinase